jgi:hyperosmotically inducible periplasmic protein
MKQTRLKTITFVTSLILSSTLIASCSTAQSRESTGQYLDSSVITTKVKTKLLADESVSGSAITVRTYKNVVQLSGFVNDNYQKYRAEKIARSVPGVKFVEDDIIVKPH